MQKFFVEDLIQHPKNDFYFDPMEGQKWKEFIESVKTSGVIEPPVVTSERIIVSGHQRIRACKELGITEINCEVRIYDSEDKVLKDLIETNIRQRGNINSSELKMGRIIETLKGIYGIAKGVNQWNAHSEQPTKTADQLAEELGMSRQAMNRYEMLLKLVPEFQEALDTGVINAKTGYSVIAKISEEEQMQLLKQLPIAAKLTQAQVQKAVDEMQGKLEDAEERLVEAQNGLTLPDDDYEAVAAQRDDAKEQCRTWYEQAQTDKKEKKALENKLKAKEQEAADLARRLEKAATKPETKEVIKEVEVIPEKYLKLEDDLRKAREQIVALQNPTDNSSDPKDMRVIQGNFTPEQYAADDARDLYESISDLLQTTAQLSVNSETCFIMPQKYKDLIVRQGHDLIENLNTIFTYFEKGDTKQCKTA